MLPSEREICVIQFEKVYSALKRRLNLIELPNIMLFLV